MKTENLFTELAANGREATKRLAVKKTAQATRTAIVKVITKNSDSLTADMAAEFLKTEAGEGLLKLIAGFALPFIPKVGDDKRVAVLTEELRISGMADIGNNVLDVVITEMGPVLQEVIGAAESLEESEDATGNAVAKSKV